MDLSDQHLIDRDSSRSPAPPTPPTDLAQTTPPNQPSTLSRIGVYDTRFPGLSPESWSDQKSSTWIAHRSRFETPSAAVRPKIRPVVRQTPVSDSNPGLDDTLSVEEWMDSSTPRDAQSASVTREPRRVSLLLSDKSVPVENQIRILPSAMLPFFLFSLEGFDLILNRSYDLAGLQLLK